MSEENVKVKENEVVCTPVPLHGRRKLYTMAEELTRDNVLSEILYALSFHMMNVAEINYLYWYRRGVQPVLNRTKEIRSEICNKVCINNADFIVTFKNGYFLTKPATYVSRTKDDKVTQNVQQLNDYLYLSGKHDADNLVAEWFHTCGVGVLFTKPSKEVGVPMKAYALDPRCAAVVYSLNPGNEPVYGFNVVTQGKKAFIDVYTKTKIFKLESGTWPQMEVTDFPDLTAIPYRLVSEEPNYIGEVPIIEYEYNTNRIGAFEKTISIQDAINNTESNRQDGIDQFIQSLMVLYNCDLEEGTTADSIRKAGMILLKNIGENKADVKILSEALDQSQTQTTLDDLYEQMLEKSGLPSSVRDGGSTSDNVGAVYLRNGWAMADTDARNTEDNFKRANRLFDRIFTKVVAEKTKGWGKPLVINPADIELNFARNSMQNMLVKTQSALNMKQLGLAPEIALERSGLSNDPLTDIEVSADYIKDAWAVAKPVANNNPDEVTPNE